jgi:hypothetical protein
MISARVNRAPEIKRALATYGVRHVCDALGLTSQGGRTVQHQAGGGLIVRCVWHEENTPSLSIRIAPDGTIACKCQGTCGRGADVLDLIAEVRGLNTKTQFREVLAEGARLAGLWGIVDELEGREGRANVPPPAPVATPARPEPPRDYPPVAEVEALWDASVAVSDVPEVAAYLAGRAIDPDRIESGDLARALPDRNLPRWASYRGGADFSRPWPDLGYRIVVPAYSSDGAMRSVRAWRIVEGDGPKRLPPGGHKASGLVLADAWGIAMLTGARQPERVIIAEGEPDGLVNMIRNTDPRTAVLSVLSGSWTPEFAERVPVGCHVFVRTHLDAAGDRYAAEIEASLRRRAFVYRLSREAVAASVPKETHGQVA